MKWKSTITPEEITRLAAKHNRSEQSIHTAIRLICEEDNWEAADEILGTHGVESIKNPDDTKDDLQYLNSGDTYDLTICGVFRNESITCDNESAGEIFAGSWGGWLEEQEQEYLEERGMIRCSYCGEFTDENSDDWRHTVCTHCGKNVSTGE